MANLPWLTSFDSGVENLDQYRQRFLGLINRLHRAVVRQDFVVIESLLDELYTHSISCFECEERLMSECGYRYLELHMRSHDRFLERFGRYWQRYQAGEDNSKRIASFLQKWIVYHFAYEDGDYMLKIPQVPGGSRIPSAMPRRHWWDGIFKSSTTVI